MAPRSPPDFTVDAYRGLLAEREGDMIRYALDRREPLRVEWESFLSALRSGSEPLVRGWDGYAALSIARAIQRAGRTHDVVAPAYRLAGAL